MEKMHKNITIIIISIVTLLFVKLLCEHLETMKGFEIQIQEITSKQSMLGTTKNKW